MRTFRSWMSICAATANCGSVASIRRRNQVLKHLRVLWGYEVSLEGIDADTGKQVYEVCTAKSEAAEKAA